MTEPERYDDMLTREMREAYDDMLLRRFGTLAMRTPGVGYDMPAAQRRAIRRNAEVFAAAVRAAGQSAWEALLPLRMLAAAITGDTKENGSHG